MKVCGAMVRKSWVPGRPGD